MPLLNSQGLPIPTSDETAAMELAQNIMGITWTAAAIGKAQANDIINVAVNLICKCYVELIPPEDAGFPHRMMAGLQNALTQAVATKLALAKQQGQMTEAIRAAVNQIPSANN